MVIVFDAQAAVTPAGKFVGVPMPVAPVVVCVMFVKAVLIHKVGVVDAAPAVFAGHVFGDRSGAAHPQGETIHAALTAAIERDKSRFIALPEALQKFVVCRF